MPEQGVGLLLRCETAVPPRKARTTNAQPNAAMKHEPSFREDLIFALFLVPLAIILPINAVSTALMISSLILILIVELLNSAIEWIIDYVRPEIHPLAKRIKDMASAAVFLSYINCVVVWVIMLWPENAVWKRLGNMLSGQ